MFARVSTRLTVPGKNPKKRRKKMWNSETDPEMMNFVDALDIAVSP